MLYVEVLLKTVQNPFNVMRGFFKILVRVLRCSGASTHNFAAVPFIAHLCDRRSQQQPGLGAQTDAKQRERGTGKVKHALLGQQKRRRDKPGGGSGWSWRAAIRKEGADNAGSLGGGVGSGSAVNTMVH